MYSHNAEEVPEFRTSNDFEVRVMLDLERNLHVVVLSSTNALVLLGGRGCLGGVNWMIPCSAFVESTHCVLMVCQWWNKSLGGLAKCQ